MTDIYAALPSITGKFEMEYEGELKGAEAIARELIRASVASVADGYLSHLETRQVVEWFDLGGSLQLADSTSAEDLLARTREVQGLIELAHAAGIPVKARPALLASGVDFVLEGLCALKKIGRSDERGLSGHRDARAASRTRSGVSRRNTDANRRREEEVLQLASDYEVPLHQVHGRPAG